MLNKQKIVLLDITSNNDHINIKNKAIGASEYQLYNLVNVLSKNYNITCYNNKNNTTIDNIIYKSWQKDLLIDQIEQNTNIIIQRMLPNVKKEVYDKIKNNKIYLWVHDLISNDYFLFNYTGDERKYYNNSNNFKDEILQTIYENKNIHFVFVSNYIKEQFIIFFKKYNIVFKKYRLNVIYNILYEEEFINIKNNNIVVNKNYITYASAWQKGIEQVINVFDHAKKVDNDLKLVLLSPGYDWNNFKDYADNLKTKYKDDVIIHGPVNKEEYSKIIKESMVVLTTTFRETFGCVFAESYYLETPVIADYRSGAVKEIIDNNYIVNFDNKQETVNKILYLKQNRDNIKIKLDDKFMLDYNIHLWNKLQQ
jgi:hypothetical protein